MVFCESIIATAAPNAMFIIFSVFLNSKGYEAKLFNWDNLVFNYPKYLNLQRVFSIFTFALTIKTQNVRLPNLEYIQENIELKVVLCR